MDIVAQVISAWIGNGSHENPYRPQLADEYNITWQDITGTASASLIPPVNAVILEIFTDDQTYQSIASDPDYTVIAAEEVTDPNGQ